MADPGGPALSPARFGAESNDAVLALLAEISGSLKDLSMALQDQSARLLKLEEADSQNYARSTDLKNQTEFLSKDHVLVKINYGDFPAPTLCRQLFGFEPPEQPQVDQCSLWIKEKRLVFPRDERGSFKFDAVSLARIESLDQLRAKCC